MGRIIRNLFPAATAAALTLLAAACGQNDSSLETSDSDIFLRETPPQDAPIPPAPEIEDLPPAPELSSSEVSIEDQRALTEACTELGRSSPEACACMAEAAAERLDARAYLYFAARARGDSGTAAELESDMSLGEMADLVGQASRIALECGGDSG